jgi:hypothetical protein
VAVTSASFRPESGLTSVEDGDPLLGERDEGEDRDETTSLLDRLWRGWSREVGCRPTHAHGESPATSQFYASLLEYELRIHAYRFCYLRCLHPIDQATFKEVFIDIIMRSAAEPARKERMITQGCMLMCNWASIMRRNIWVRRYELWRYAYGGERSGRATLNTSVTSRYHVFVEEFGRATEATTSLLYTAGHIEQMSVFVVLLPAERSNVEANDVMWSSVTG